MAWKSPGIWETSISSETGAMYRSVGIIYKFNEFNQSLSPGRGFKLAANGSNGSIILFISMFKNEPSEEIPSPKTIETFPVKMVKASIVKNARSEERRVGKECRSQWSEYH